MRGNPSTDIFCTKTMFFSGTWFHKIQIKPFPACVSPPKLSYLFWGNANRGPTRKHVTFGFWEHHSAVMAPGRSGNKFCCKTRRRNGISCLTLHFVAKKNWNVLWTYSLFGVILSDVDCVARFFFANHFRAPLATTACMWFFSWHVRKQIKQQRHTRFAQLLEPKFVYIVNHLIRESLCHIPHEHNFLHSFTSMYRTRRWRTFQR